MPDDPRARADHLLRTEIAPALGLPPDDVTVLDLTDGIAHVRLGAGCAGCGGIPTLAALIEHELRARMPEVEIVTATGD